MLLKFDKRYYNTYMEEKVNSDESQPSQSNEDNNKSKFFFLR